MLMAKENRNINEEKKGGEGKEKKREGEEKIY
jgi:hypothetical protein